MDGVSAAMLKMLFKPYNLLILLYTGRLLKFECRIRQPTIDLGPPKTHSSTRTIAALASAMSRGTVQVGPILCVNRSISAVLTIQIIKTPRILFLPLLGWHLLPPAEAARR